MSFWTNTSPSKSTTSGLTAALKNQDFGMIFDWFSAYFFRGAVACMILIGAAAAPSRGWDSARIVGVSFVFACACTLCGWLLGLLFGIPRTLSRPQAAPAATDGAAAAPAAGTTAVAATSRVNTNLEDVSDWLTKTLVGVGLTQLHFVPHYLWQSADKLNKVGFMWEGPGQLLAVALFLYFAPGGFWLSYIATRTILTKLFASLEGPSQSTVDAALAEKLKIDPQGRIDPKTAPETQSADAAMLAFDVDALKDPRELTALGAAKARNNDLESATAALKKATTLDPKNLLAKETLATVYAAQSRKTEAQQVLPDENNEVAMFLALYQHPPEGFTKAIDIGSRLLQQPGAANNLNLHVWLACAYGQQHAQAKRNGDNALADTARQNAINEVDAAIKIDPDKARPLLRSFWRTTEGSIDDDLASIPQDDPDLTRLLM